MSIKTKMFILYVVCLLQVVIIALYNYKNYMAVIGSIFMAIVMTSFTFRDNKDDKE